MDTKKTLSVLEDLLHVSKDGEATFGRAREMTDDDALAEAFQTTQRSCAVAVEQLTERIQELGGEPGERGTVPGAARRAWIETRRILSLDKDDTLLEEIVRAEKAAAKHYEDALETPLPSDVQQMISSQASGAEANLRRFEALAREAS